MTSTAIVMTMYRRPEYTRQVLASLERCQISMFTIPVYLCVDPGCDEVLDIAKDFATRNPRASVYTADERMGCNGNTFASLDMAFADHERVIALEDDTVLGADALLYFLWALDKYANDKTVFDVSAYHRTNQVRSDTLRSVHRRAWFTPWGWATWRDRWQDVQAARQTSGFPPQASWDELVNHAARGNRFEVYPVLSRTLNIGAVDGEHVPSPEWHAANHWNPLWVDAFNLSDIPTTPWSEIDVLSAQV